MLLQRHYWLLCEFKDTNYPSPVGCRMIILVLPITTIVILGCCTFVSLFRHIVYIICDRLKNSEELLTVSINSSVINVCNLLNLLWSWESIMPDIFSADSPSLPLVLCMAFPHWLSMLRWNRASLYRWCVRNTKLMVFTLFTRLTFL